MRTVQCQISSSGEWEEKQKQICAGRRRHRSLRDKYSPPNLEFYSLQAGT